MSENPDFTKVNTADFADKDFACSCGMQHSVKTKKILLGENAISMLLDTVREITPAGKAVFISCQDIMEPYGVRIAGMLESAGYQLSNYIFPKNSKPDIRMCGSLLKAPEDARFAVSFGGGSVTDIAKYYCSICGKKLVSVTSAPSMDGYLSGVSALYVNGFKETLKSVPPYALLCDLNIMRKAPPNFIAAGFGDICAKLTALTDWYFAKCVAGEYFCENIYNLALQCTDMCLNAAEGLINRNSASIDVLCDALLRSSLCMQMLGNSRCASGGEHHLAHLIEMMRIKENKENALHGETAFLSQKYILGIYRHFFEKKYADLLPPPDKALHAAVLSKAVNMDYFTALSKMDYDLSPQIQTLYKYKTEEFRGDILNLLKKASRKYDLASMVFKRIYPDAGFWINGFISENELKTGIALAADIRNRFTILSHMRNCGLFEKYLN